MQRQRGDDGDRQLAHDLMTRNPAESLPQLSSTPPPWSMTHARAMTSLIGRLFRAGPGADLRAAQRGDRAAIARVYDAHVDGLYAFVFYRVGRDATLAEDVVQETFTLALTKQADYDPARGSIASWLA